MFSTINSRIIVLTISIMLLLTIILTFVGMISFKNAKGLMQDSCDFTITTLVEKINKEITSLERSAIDLSLIGEIYYNANRNENILKYAVPEIFKSNKYSIGGGIWFDPKYIKADNRLLYTYAYTDKDKEIKLDEKYQYDYLIQNWYKEIITKTNTNTIAWSTPYYESEGSNTLMVTAGAAIYDNNLQVIGVSTADWQIDAIVNTVSNMRPTPNSFALFADKANDYVILSTYGNETSHLGSSLKEISWYKPDLQDREIIKYNNVEYVSFVKTLDNGMILIVNVPKNELLNKILKNTLIILAILFTTSLLTAGGTYIMLTRDVNHPIDKLTDIAKKIGKGDLDTEIKLNKPKEFADLADTFNKMTKDIKTHINNLKTVTQEKEKIEAELSIAKTIQYSVLPSTFYPNMKQFSIYASMDTAKEVGGDFYDFFFINPNQFMFLIADVSGKGIPAALFMMTTKTLIKNIANENYSPKELIEKVNKQVCENNKQGMFVTMFAGIVDINTGHTVLVNCGHNPPLIKKDGTYKYMDINSNLVLGAYPDFEYKIEEIQLEENDVIFLYTDGVTEALNENQDLYGEKRLINYLNKDEIKEISDLKNLVENVKSDVNQYINDTPQSDDITMLAFKFNKKGN